jgi:hypothetical protein
VLDMDASVLELAVGVYGIFVRNIDFPMDSVLYLMFIFSYIYIILSFVALFLRLEKCEQNS